MKKRIILFFMVLVLVMAFVGCNMLSVNEERDGKQVVATVNGDKIYKSVVLNNAKTYLGQYGYTEDLEDYGYYMDQIMQQLLEEEIKYTIFNQKCDEFGVEKITADQKAEIETMRSVLFENMNKIANNNFPEDEYPDAAEREALVKEYAENRLAEYGYYDGSYDDSFSNSYLVDNLVAYLTKDYAPSDEDLREFYDNELADQKRVLENSYDQLDSLESTSVLVYVPEGIRYVRNLLIAIPDEVRDEIESLRSSGDSAAADALRDEELAKLKDKVDEAYHAATSDFDSALESYGEDPGMKNETLAKTGYRIYKNNASYDSVFVETGMGLVSVGDISEPTASDFGYYIIEYTSDMQAGEVPFDDVKDEILTHMISKNETETLNVNLGFWLEDSEIVRYEKRLKYID